MVYDYIIIGAGIGGLSAGLNLISHGKRVLILEKNTFPGGMTSTFKRGRFEFDTSNFYIYNYGANFSQGITKNILDKYGVKVDVLPAYYDVQIKDLMRNKEYQIKGNFQDFCLKMEKLEPNSIVSIHRFKEVAHEIYAAYKRLVKGIVVSEENYPNFYKYLDMNVYDALIDLKMSKTTINYFCYQWLELGSPINKLSFIDFCVFMKRQENKEPVILARKNNSLTLDMVERFEKLGGKIAYNSFVTRIEKQTDFLEVTTIDDIKYMAKDVICDVSQKYVYTNLIKEENKAINQLENAKKPSFNGLYVYLGLNKDYQEIGLNNYQYLAYQDLNSLKAFSNMDYLGHKTIEAIVPNVLNPKASLKGTTILVLKTLYYDNPFKVSKNKYYEVKESLAADLINNFEEIFQIDIKEYIEEIEVATPKTVFEYTSKDNGNLFGYMRASLDNSINRLINYEDELIPHIYFVGSSSIFGSGFDNTLYSGYYVTQKILEKEVDVE